MNDITQLEIKGVDYSTQLCTGVNKLILENVNLEIKSQDNRSTFTSIIAPIGSGKSTLLKIICGLISPSKAQIIFFPESKKSQITKVVLINDSQNYLPWLSVKKNIEFTLANSRYEGKKSSSEIQSIIDLVGLNGYEDHIPNSKSHGFIIRISIANALITNPEFILFDDPFRNFSSQSRLEVYHIIQKIQSKIKVNFILATSNIFDAVLMSDMIFMMKQNPGVIFDSMKIDRLKISASLEKNDYTSEIIMDVQNRFRAKSNCEVINLSI